MAGRATRNSRDYNLTLYSCHPFIRSSAFQGWLAARGEKGNCEGVQDVFFAYYSGSAPAFGNDGKYQVPLARVRLNAGVAEEEIDLESGFLMMPQAVPVVAPGAESASVDPNAPGGAPVGEPPLVLTPPSGP